MSSHRSQILLRSARSFSAALLLCGMLGCAPAVFPLSRTNYVAGADGEVRVAAGPNNNTLVRIRVRHLAPPERIVPGASSYVVWVRSEAGGFPPQNIGALSLRDESGELESVTPLRVFTVFLTAESQPTVMAPSGPEVMGARVVRN